MDGLDVQEEGEPKEDNAWEVGDYSTDYIDLAVIL